MESARSKEAMWPGGCVPSMPSDVHNRTAADSVKKDEAQRVPVALSVPNVTLCTSAPAPRVVHYDAAWLRSR